MHSPWFQPVDVSPVLINVAKGLLSCILRASTPAEDKANERSEQAVFQRIRKESILAPSAHSYSYCQHRAVRRLRQQENKSPTSPNNESSVVIRQTCECMAASEPSCSPRPSSQLGTRTFRCHGCSSRHRCSPQGIPYCHGERASTRWATQWQRKSSTNRERGAIVLRVQLNERPYSHETAAWIYNS